jgi:hypothetical protein
VVARPAAPAEKTSMQLPVPLPTPDPTRALFAARAADWLGAVARRRSRRAYRPERVPTPVLDELDTVCAGFRPHRCARVVLVRDPATDVFTGVIGSYGKIVGAQHILVFIGSNLDEFGDQHVGYTGEAIVLEATRLELATCWVGGFFSPKKVADVVDLIPGERAFAVSPVGTALSSRSTTEMVMAKLAGAERHKSVAQLAPDSRSGSWPQWAVAAVETARLAPSALNRQPWRFRMEGDSLVVARDSAVETPRVTKRLDIGIAMLHIELAAAAHRVRGTWTDLASPDVARFDPTPTAETNQIH